jgi:hypothetical protein
MEKIRQYALSEVLRVVPFCRDCAHSDQKTHRAAYEEVVEATGFKWQPGAQGTTCGFLCHWLLWRIGVQDPGIVNWTDTKRGTTFTSGKDNMSKIRYGRKGTFYDLLSAPVNPIELWPAGGGPDTGDIIHIIKEGGDKGVVENTDHMFVFLSNNPLDKAFEKRDMAKSKTPAGAVGSPLIWVTGESGQGPIGKATDALLKSRQVYVSGKLRSHTKLEDGENRSVSGWLCLEKLDYDEGAVNKIVGA